MFLLYNVNQNFNEEIIKYLIMLEMIMDLFVQL